MVNRAVPRAAGNGFPEVSAASKRAAEAQAGRGSLPAAAACNGSIGVLEWYP
jgi:hypothetical protein